MGREERGVDRGEGGFVCVGMICYHYIVHILTVTLYAAEDDRKLDREKFPSTHANSHLPNGELGGYGYNANNIYIYIYIYLYNPY